MITQAQTTALGRLAQMNYRWNRETIQSGLLRLYSEHRLNLPAIRHQPRIVKVLVATVNPKGIVKMGDVE